MDMLYAILDASWTMLVLAAPYILFGLAIAGLMHVLLPESLVIRWMGHPGLSGVVRAAILGVPLPVCSCGVVPITVELRRKGASRPAAQSFLITTPESSIDSIFLTWGMMGPVMAIARPVAAFFTAVLGGILSIASARSLDELIGEPRSSQGAPDDDHSDHDHSDHDHCHHHHHHGHGHDHHDHDHSVAFAGSANARRALAEALGLRRKKNKRKTPDTEATDAEDTSSSAETTLAEDAVDHEDDGHGKNDETGLWPALVRPTLRYGFGELLDDLAFWLVVGVGLAGLLTALLPDNLETLGLGTGIWPMLALLVIGIPLYMCASASTPIAAALLLKGISPGAALVFLLAGPATNAATVLQLTATFGRRFVQIYVISVAAGALGAGLLLDFLLGDIDVTKELRLSAETSPGAFSVILALLLAGLLALSLWRGAWASGVGELRGAAQSVRSKFSPSLRIRKRHLLAALLLVAATTYALSGFRVVPAGTRGYGFLFGKLVQSDLEPGLHYLPPAPFGQWQTRLIDYPRKSDVGFRTDLSLVQRRRELIGEIPRDDWHSPVAALTIATQANYLTGDGNLLEMSFSVHYRTSDAERFFFGVDHGKDFVNLYAEAAAREIVAGLPLDELLTARRTEVEERILGDLQAAMDEHRLGIEVTTIRIVDLHPPGAAVHAFRDVSSAKEDRETAIHRARGELAQAIPRSRGQAAKRVADAEAAATRRQLEAQGESEAFSARATPFGQHRELLSHLLWIESAERTLVGREKLILPPDQGGSRGLTLWRDSQSSRPPLLRRSARPTQLPPLPQPPRLPPPENDH